MPVAASVSSPASNPNPAAVLAPRCSVPAPRLLHTRAHQTQRLCSRIAPSSQLRLLHTHVRTAGGTELHFQRLPGVVATCVGYTQGKPIGYGGVQPTYKEVCSGRTGHTEAVLVVFKPSEVSFATLCEKLMSTIDPTLLNQVGLTPTLPLALAPTLTLTPNPNPNPNPNP